jgi:putative ABC transport system permease protein
MLSWDRWHEIFGTLWRSKLRSMLTAFAMAWGVFMLVFLLGLGTGMEQGVRSGFADDATNSVWLFTGSTSVPHEGMPIGRRVVLRNDDVDRVKAMPGVEHITGRYFAGGNRFSSSMRLSAGTKAGAYDVRSVHPDHLYLERTIMVAGRFINDRDVAERRKVVIIGEPIARFFFPERDPIGLSLSLNRVSFTVVGVFTDDGEAGEAEKVYIPISAGQAAFNGADRVNMLMYTVGDLSVDASHALTDDVRATLAEQHRFAPSDPSAIRVRNNLENFESFMQIFRMMSVFVWFMAGATILAGVIGVSNIMMIVVRERTKEIGIRKALGATPANIVGTIVQESVFLTAAAGYLGLLAGVGILALIEAVVPPNDMFAAPRVDLGVALTATAILVAAGALAGFFPALSAARVNPIVALRDE